MSARRFIGRGRALMGWPGGVSAAVLALGLALYTWALKPAQERLAAARAHAEAMQKRLESARSTPGRPASIDDQLAAFYAMFPKEQDATEVLAKLVSIAQRDGVDLQGAEYKAERDKNSQLMRFHVMLPLKGEYQTLRAFLLDLRKELPSVSLEQVQFERRKVGDRVVDAKVKLVIFLGRSS